MLVVSLVVGLRLDQVREGLDLIGDFSLDLIDLGVQLSVQRVDLIL